MRYILLLSLLYCFDHLTAQYINCEVRDAETAQPLYYATIYYGKKPVITFSDSLGIFFLNYAIAQEKDSLTIEFIGYKKILIPKEDLIQNKIFYLHKLTNSLENVLVKNCKQYEEKNINYGYSKMNSYWTVSPNTRVSYISYFENKDGLEGYISKLIFYTPSPVLHKQDFSTPIRIRWYEWDSTNQLPGKELTDTSIIIFANKNGLNEIQIPEKTVYWGHDGIVIGVEFLYPPALEQEYVKLSNDKERNTWLIKHQWSIGTSFNKDNCEGFVQSGKNNIRKFAITNGFLKMALDFKIITCQ